MSNIENFAQVGTYDTAGGIHPVNDNSDGYISGSELAAFQQQHQQPHHGGGDPLMGPTNAELANQQAANVAITEDALAAVMKQNTVGSAANNGGVDNAADSTAHTAEYTTDATTNAHEGGMLTVNNEMQQSQHDLGVEAGMANAERNAEDGSQNPEYTQNDVTDLQTAGDHNEAQYAQGYVQGYQTGGDGYRLGVDAEMVGGQAVVEGYDSEQAVCSDNQVGGGSPFNFITDPDTNQSLSIFSDAGKALLKSYVKAYKQMQSGGAALLEGVEPNATGALYDGVEGAGAEYMPDACGLTYDAQGDNWTHTQIGGGKKHKKRKSKRHSKSKGRAMEKRPCGCDKDCKSCKKYGCDNDPSKCKC